MKKKYLNPFELRERLFCLVPVILHIIINKIIIYVGENMLSGTAKQTINQHLKKIFYKLKCKIKHHATHTLTRSPKHTVWHLPDLYITRDPWEKQRTFRHKITTRPVIVHESLRPGQTTQGGRPLMPRERVLPWGNAQQ